MTTDQQIEKQLQDELVKFSNEVYKGKVEVPSNIIEVFKKCYMTMATQAHKVQGLKIKAITSKSAKKLTNADLSDVIKIVVSTPLEKVYDDFETALAEHIKLEKFILCYNELVSEFQKGLQMKKVTLQNLSGKGINNGMRIIPQA